MEQILRTEASARHKAEQLQLTLENMSQGIMLVTKDLQIPIINSRCGELLDLPAEFIEHPPRFDQLIEYQANSAAHVARCCRRRHAAFASGAPTRGPKRPNSRSANARCRTAP